MILINELFIDVCVQFTDTKLRNIVNFALVNTKKCENGILIDCFNNNENITPPDRGKKKLMH